MYHKLCMDDRFLFAVFQRSTSRSLGTDSTEESENVLVVSRDTSKSGSFKKRHSAGEVAERIQKSKSLIIQTDLK